MPYNIPEIATLSNQALNETVKIRRYLHQNPELSYKENNTSEFIKKTLKLIGIHDLRTVAGTGVLAHIRGEKGDGKNIVLRAELDALPIDEKTGLSFASNKKGVMHACGHDAHMAMLLSSASIFQKLKSNLKGNIYFLFQPGEELAPGGASLVMDEGILQEIKPDAIIAQHVLPELESGKFGFRSGKYMASSDEIYIDISGRGGHAALPGASSDQIAIGAKLVCDLKSAVESIIKDKPAVLGIGKFIADGATNVIPGSVHIEGTLRAFDESLRSDIHSILQKVCKDSEIENVKIDLEIRKGYPVLINNNDLCTNAKNVAEKLNGKNSVEMLELRMSSEDFAYYSLEFPVLFYRLGVKDPEKHIRNLHSSDFDLHEKAMEYGIRTITAIAINILV